VVFGSPSDNNAKIDGIVGVYYPEAAKVKHKATIWGMYVRPSARRTGVATGLLGKAIEHASCFVEEMNLTVGLNNRAALALYGAAGFQEYGLEKRALKIKDQYYDEVLMSLLLVK
jgi:ribosomal protein S18 acetylase RimI-like enzyme